MYDEKVTLTQEWEPKVFWDNAVKSELFHRGTRAAPLTEAGATSDITELFSLSRQKLVRMLERHPGTHRTHLPTHSQLLHSVPMRNAHTHTHTHTRTQPIRNAHTHTHTHREYRRQTLGLVAVVLFAKQTQLQAVGCRLLESDRGVQVK
jgi:hypothetical protein